MSAAKPISVMAFGVGAYTHGMLTVLKDHGADVSAYLTRNYAHYAPSLAGPTFDSAIFPDPGTILAERTVDFVLPMSIDWAEKPWAQDFLRQNIPIFCPTGEALLLERDRDFARSLCAEYGVPFPRA